MNDNYVREPLFSKDDLRLVIEAGIKMNIKFIGDNEYTMKSYPENTVDEITKRVVEYLWVSSLRYSEVFGVI